jgi:hypothetical protein
MSRTRPNWHGTEEEWGALLDAVDLHCACLYTSMGTPLRRCVAHSILQDQRALDGLLWMRRLRTRLQREEQSVSSPDATTWAARHEAAESQPTASHHVRVN